MVKYYHENLIGTTRFMTNASGDKIEEAVYTAFGELVSGGARRFGYAGVYGYQTDQPGEMPFVHVGHRYYDPSTGRFLQRDPIGIRGGLNVYAYAANGPTGKVDPSGLESIGPIWGPHGEIPKPKPRPPKRPKPPETPQQERDRIKRRLIITAGAYGLCAAATFWAPPISATFTAGAVASGTAAGLMD